MGDQEEQRAEHHHDGKATSLTQGAPEKALHQAVIEATKSILANSDGTLEQSAAYFRDLAQYLSEASTLTPPPGDKRFQDPLWSSNPFYQGAMQGYLTWAKSMEHFAGLMGANEQARQQARFVINQITSALSPTNSLFGNPAALQRLTETGGQSAFDGFSNYITDLLTNGGMPSQVDKSKHKVGVNLGLTPGGVIFRNDMLELIQYAPKVRQAYERPVLFIPSQINKFYILDLAPGRSFIEFCLENGLQVFVISWRNPVAEHKDWGLEDYVRAIAEACDAIRDITGSSDVNLLSICGGGMTSAALLAHEASTGQSHVHAATLVVTLLDNAAEATSLSLFATPETVDLARQATQSQGVLEGQDMSRVFAWMRPNDLVWNYWVNNYLMGNPPPAFDILYWNNDTTRLPARLHGEMMDMGLKNSFASPGSFSILGTPVDLKNVTCDIYIVAGLTDHICPWKGVYASADLFGGTAEFVLAGSGHIQSFVNPPGNPKASYFINGSGDGTADQWLDSATKHTDSFWGHWLEWVIARSGKKVSVSSIGNALHPSLQDAPGSYVLEP